MIKIDMIIMQTEILRGIDLIMGKETEIIHGINLIMWGDTGKYPEKDLEMGKYMNTIEKIQPGTMMTSVVSIGLGILELSLERIIEAGTEAEILD